MEIRCSKCSHVGEAALDVKGADVALVCENCGFRNRLDMPQSAEAPATKPSQPLPTRAPNPAQIERQEFEEEAFRRLLPSPGNGPRCLKCYELLELDQDHCMRCGLNIEESRKFAPGQAPWDRPPAGREDAWDEADLMWRRLKEDWGEERFDDFAQTIRRLEAWEFASRKLRSHLVENPDDELAKGFLREIAAGLQSRVMVAKAQAQASAAQFSDATEKVRRVLLWVVSGMWAVIIVLILVYYFG